MSDDMKLKPQTRVIEAGYNFAENMNSAKPPIYQTSTFVFNTSKDGEEFFAASRGAGTKAGMIYSRINNPNLEILEARLKVFDGAEAAASFSSGLSAIATTAIAMSRKDSYLIYASPIYGGTEVLFEKHLSHLGMKFRAVHAGDNLVNDIRSIVEQEGTVPYMILIETPANPSIAMTDITEVVELAKSLGEGTIRPLVAVDNTFLGPIFQQPIKQGADFVLYSCTKFIGGHSDIIAGAALGPKELIAKIKGFRSSLGTTLSPFQAWLATRSLETLDLRMRKCAENASRLAVVLADHPEVVRVDYPELYAKGSKQREIYEKQCSGPGSLISFEVASKEQAFKFLDNLKVFVLAVSLGGNESLAQHPAAMTHSGVPKEDLIKFGIGDGMVRLSVGLEDGDDLIADVLQALEASKS